MDLYSTGTTAGSALLLTSELHLSAFCIHPSHRLNLSMLFTNAPKWEELTKEEKDLYHDKDQFNKISRKGGKILTFAKSGAHGETWVPLIEKAYAKFYGCYNHLQGGFPREAIEDLTG